MANVGQSIFAVAGAVIGMFFGNPMLGFSIGMMIGGLLFPPDVEDAQSLKPSGLQVMSSQYGVPIPVLYGKRRIPGNLIWYGNFKAIKVEVEAGKGMGGRETGYYYIYRVSCAIGLCMGKADVLKVWANNKVVDPNKYTVYSGAQLAADPHISAKLASEGKRVPVWKNLCYVVFDNYSLGQSPTLPNFSFEVSKVVTETLGTNFVGEAPTNGKRGGAASFDGIVVTEKYIVTVHPWGQYDTDKKAVRVWDKETGEYLGGTNTSRTGLLYARKVFLADHHICIFHYTEVAGVHRDFLSHYDPRSCSVTYTKQLNLPVTVSGIMGWSEKEHVFWCYYPGWPGTDYFISLDKDGFVLSQVAFPTVGYSEMPFGEVTHPDYIFLSSGGGMVGARMRCVRKSNGTVKWGPREPASFYLTCLAYDAANEMLIIGTSSGFGFVDAKNGNSVGSIGVGRYTHCVTKMRTGYDDDNPRRSQYVVGVYRPGPIAVLVGDVKGFRNVGTITPSPVSASQNGVALEGSTIYISFNGSSDFCDRVASVTLRVDGFDDNPANVTFDILTNKLYGSGLDATYLNSAVWGATQHYCDINDLLFSFYFDRQITFIDAIQYILQHHDGFFSYYNGKLAHRQNRNEDATVHYTVDDVEKNNEQFPVSLTKPGREGYSNHIIVEYTRRNNDYYVGTAKADDMPDINRFGKKPETIRLDGIMTHKRAQMLANLILRKGMEQPESISLPLLPSAQGLSPGVVFDYTDSDLELSAKKFRAVNVSEREDGGVTVDAVEVMDYYDTAMAPDFDDDSSPSPPPGISDPASAVTHVVLEEWPAMYSQGEPKLSIYFSAPDEVQWAGAYGYRSYTSGGTFDLVDKQFSSGITGVVTAVGILAGKPYITITLDTEDTLSSAVSLDALLQTPFQNLFILQGAYGTVYCRFATCTLLSAKVWRLTDLLIDLTGFTQLTSSLSVIATDLVAVYNDKRRVNLTVADLYRTLYFKLASMNFAGDLQDLADCTEYDVAIIGKDKKPIQGLNLLVNGQPEVAGAHNVSEGDLLFTWMSVNRFASGCSTASVTGEEDADFQEWCIEIWDVGLTTLVNSYQSLTNSWTYTSAAQAADGGLTNFVMKLSKRGGSTVSSQTSHTVNIFA